VEAAPQTDPSEGDADGESGASDAADGRDE